ncbi:flagellar biosynthetic protein FliO [Paenibacillus larvae]|nr:flagellar biosynthetic protein FliO [Paenibacillus larvae]
MGGVPLGQNKSIQIVEIGQSLYIVGVGDNIQLLEKVDNPDQVALITAQLTGPGTSVEGFPSVLLQVAERQKIRKSSGRGRTHGNFVSRSV